uniref:Lon N-terminal domain-containing protein n=1 Tax=Eutreptiella gymnastica TaxID=73025 RepID=A0A7S4CUK9_9EUGL
MWTVTTSADGTQKRSRLRVAASACGVMSLGFVLLALFLRLDHATTRPLRIYTTAPLIATSTSPPLSRAATLARARSPPLWSSPQVTLPSVAVEEVPSHSRAPRDSIISALFARYWSLKAIAAMGAFVVVLRIQSCRAWLGTQAFVLLQRNRIPAEYSILLTGQDSRPLPRTAMTMLSVGGEEDPENAEQPEPEDSERFQQEADVSFTQGLRGAAQPVPPPPPPPAPGAPKPKYLACIPQFNLENLTLPGQVQTLHLYDRPLLGALAFGMAKGGFLVHAALDHEAAARREFRLHKYGTVLKILSQKPSKQTSKYGDSSVSRLVTVVGVRPIRVASIFQTDPFVLAAVEDTSHTLTSDCPARASRVREVFAECARLRSEIGVEGVGDVDLDNLHAAVELHNGAEVDGRALQVLALAATEGMPAAVRLKALTLSGDDDGEGLFEVVLSALEDDLRRLAALKAIG